jgi:hypothetical protein
MKEGSFQRHKGGLKRREGKWFEVRKEGRKEGRKEVLKKCQKGRDADGEEREEGRKESKGLEWEGRNREKRTWKGGIKRNGEEERRREEGESKNK